MNIPSCLCIEKGEINENFSSISPLFILIFLNINDNINSTTNPDVFVET